MGNYYPLFVDLKKIKCLVIGGGEVAYRKTLSLREADADVTIISPRMVDPLMALADMGEIKFLKRTYQKGDLKGFRLVYVAIDDKETSRQIGAEAEKEGILFNVANNPDQGNFIVPAKIQRGDLHLCFSTGGKSPLLSKKIRQDLEEKYGPEYEDFIRLLGRERVWALQEVALIDQRKAYFEELVSSDLLELIKAGRTGDISQRIDMIREKTLFKQTGGKDDDR